MLYAFTFGVFVILTIYLLNSNIGITKIILFIALTIITSILFRYLHQYVLVRSTAVMIIYIAPPLLLVKLKFEIPIKSRIILTSSIAIILLTGIFFNNDQSNPNPTKQSLKVIEYIKLIYPDSTYVLYSNDTFRNSITVVPVYNVDKK